MKKMRLFRVLLLLLIAIATLASYGNMRAAGVLRDTISFRVGGDLFYNYNFHSADFRALPGVPNCCPKFEDGTGGGVTVGGFGEIAIDEVFFLHLGLNYSMQNATLKKAEPIWLGLGNGEIYGEFEHTIEAKLSSIGLQPMLGINILPQFKFLVGVRAGFMIGKTYSQKEVITNPTDRGVFKENGLRTRNENSGDIPDASGFAVALAANLRYEFPLNANKTLFIAPSVGLLYGLTPVVSGVTWNAHTITLGLSIVGDISIISTKQPLPEVAVKPVEKVKEVPPPPVIPVVVDTKPLVLAKRLEASVRAELRDGSRKIPDNKIQVEEFLSISMRPLLTYVFFDANSSEIPARYKKIDQDEAENYNVKNLYNTPTLPTYYEMLNIVGSRLRDNPKSKLRLVGCNSNSDDEKGNLELSRKRAEAVANYLTKTWGIASDRLAVSAKNLPATPSTPDVADGIEENRRVELYSDNSDITAPVVTNDTLRLYSPNRIVFYPSVVADTTVVERQLTVWQDENQPIVTYLDSDLDSPVELDLSEKIALKQTLDKPISYKLTATDATGNTVTTKHASVTLQQKTIKMKSQKQDGDRRIDRYSIILFDFDKPTLSQEQLKQTKFIKERIEAGSKVSVTGYTDRMGDEEHNKRLSEERAKNMARALKIDDAVIKGIGRDNPLYDNTLPEGRIYCRTVEVVVETPISK